MTNSVLHFQTAPRATSLAKCALAIVGGSLLMTLAAKFQVPFYPVPMSLQTLVAIGLGFALGPFVGATAVLFYLAQGAIGLPVFASSPERGIGLAYMAGPTGGYLMGLVVATFVSGALSRLAGAERFLAALAISLLAGAVVYVPGLLWLGALMGYNAGLLEAGLYPFILGDVVKAVIAALIFAQGHAFLHAPYEGQILMRLVSYQTPAGVAGFGVLTGDGQGLADLSRHAASLRAFLADSDWEAKAEAASAGPVDTTLDAVRLSPVIPDPAKIFCVGVNYASHLLETGRELPEKPMIFTRIAQSQTGHDSPMIRPRVSEKFDFEGELAVVIGKPMRYVHPTDAQDGIAGYSCYNDGSIRDWQRHSGQFTPGKNFPATGAFGPWLVTRDAFGVAGSQKIVTRLNGEVMQEGRLDDLIFNVGELISYISHFCELEPGDVIISGTTGGVGAFRQPPIWMKAGDMVEVEIEGIGILKNRIEDEQGAADCYW